MHRPRIRPGPDKGRAVMKLSMPNSPRLKTTRVRRSRPESYRTPGRAASSCPALICDGARRPASGPVGRKKRGDPSSIRNGVRAPLGSLGAATRTNFEEFVHGRKEIASGHGGNGQPDDGKPRLSEDDVAR